MLPQLPLLPFKFLLQSICLFSAVNFVPRHDLEWHTSLLDLVRAPGITLGHLKWLGLDAFKKLGLKVRVLTAC